MRTKSIHKIRQRKTLSMLASVLAFVLIAIFSSIVFSNAQIRNVYAKKAIVTKQLDEVASLLESIKNINDIDANKLSKNIEETIKKKNDVKKHASEIFSKLSFRSKDVSRKYKDNIDASTRIATEAIEKIERLDERVKKLSDQLNKIYENEDLAFSKQKEAFDEETNSFDKKISNNTIYFNPISTSAISRNILRSFSELNINNKGLKDNLLKIRKDILDANNEFNASEKLLTSHISNLKKYKEEISAIKPSPEEIKKVSESDEKACEKILSLYADAIKNAKEWNNSFSFEFENKLKEVKSYNNSDLEKSLMGKSYMREATPQISNVYEKYLEVISTLCKKIELLKSKSDEYEEKYKSAKTLFSKSFPYRTEETAIYAHKELHNALSELRLLQEERILDVKSLKDDINKKFSQAQDDWKKWANEIRNEAKKRAEEISIMLEAFRTSSNHMYKTQLAFNVSIKNEIKNFKIKSEGIEKIQLELEKVDKIFDNIHNDINLYKIYKKLIEVSDYDILSANHILNVRTYDSYFRYRKEVARWGNGSLKIKMELEEISKLNKTIQELIEKEKSKIQKYSAVPLQDLTSSPFPNKSNQADVREILFIPTNSMPSMQDLKSTYENYLLEKGPSPIKLKSSKYMWMDDYEKYRKINGETGVLIYNWTIEIKSYDIHRKNGRDYCDLRFIIDKCPRGYSFPWMLLVQNKILNHGTAQSVNLMLNDRAYQQGKYNITVVIGVGTKGFNAMMCPKIMSLEWGKYYTLYPTLK